MARCDTTDALAVQRLLPDDELRIVASGQKDEAACTDACDDIVLVDHPANKAAPRLICVYQVDLLDFRGGKKFNFEPEKMLYAYQWLHKATPAEFRLVLMKEPEIWFEHVTTWLLGALDPARPHLFEPLRAGDRAGLLHS